MVKIKIDYAKCVGDEAKICVEICLTAVFKDGKFEKPKVVNAKNCILCRTCRVNCPNQAIEILT